MLKLNSILLGSENPEPLVAFYTKILGPPTMEEGGFTGWGGGRRVPDDWPPFGGARQNLRSRTLHLVLRDC